MPRPVWKGKQILNTFYRTAVNNYEEEILDYSDWDLITDWGLKLHRRNMYIHPFFLKYAAREFVEMYTGYDFLDKILSPNNVGYNLATIINTRETKVVHRKKQTKQQRKNAATLQAKKKLINSSKKGDTKSKKKPVKKLKKK